MWMALNAKNKLGFMDGSISQQLGFIDGSISQPSPDEPTAGVWSRCNSMVISWLLNAVFKDIAGSLLYLDTAQAVWANLHDRFRQSNPPRIFQIKQQLHGLTQGSLDLSTYYTCLKILWDEHYKPVPVYNC